MKAKLKYQVQAQTPDIFVFKLINTRPFIKGRLKGLPCKEYISISRRGGLRG